MLLLMSGGQEVLVSVSGVGSMSGAGHVIAEAVVGVEVAGALATGDDAVSGVVAVHNINNNLLIYVANSNLSQV